MPSPRLLRVKAKIEELFAKFGELSRDAKKRVFLGALLLALMLFSLILFVTLKNRPPELEGFGVPDDFGILTQSTVLPQQSPLAPGASAWKSGYPWRALDHFTAALSAGLSQAETIAAWNYCGHIRIALGDYAQAGIAFSAANGIKPNAGAEYGLGRIAQLTKDIPQALHHYARATELRDDFALAWRRQGDCLFGEGGYAAARERYSRALVRSDEELLRFRLAECALYLGERDDARRQFTRLIESAQNKTITAYTAARLADMESDEGKLGQAIAYYRQAIADAPEAAAFRYNLGGLYLMDGQLEDAVAVYDALRVQKIGGGHQEALAEAFARNLGEVFYDRDDNESALHFLRSSGEEDYEILSMLGDLSLLRGEDDLALEYYRRVLALEPLSRLAFLAYANSATIYLNRGQPERALAAYRKAMEIEPENPRLLYNLGFALLQNGERREAREAFVNAYQADRTLTNALLALAATAAPGQESAASLVLEARDLTEQENFFAESLLARAYHLSREYGKAIASAERALRFAPKGTPLIDTQLLLLRSLLANQDYEAAGKLLLELRDANSQNPLYLYCAAIHALRTGNAGDGARFLGLAREYARGPSLRAAISYWQGNLAWQAGATGDALAKYRETLDLVPSHTAAAYNAAYCVKQLADSRDRRR